MMSVLKFIIKVFSVGIFGSLVGYFIGMLFSHFGTSCTFFCKPLNGAISGGIIAVLYWGINKVIK